MIQSIKKFAIFGLLGAVGCLIAAAVGELLIRFALPKQVAGGGAAITMVARPAEEIPVKAPPPPPAEFDKLLKERGAQTGDVQISLRWNNVNDLDLHCIDPSGFRIWYPPPNRRSPTGGELDVDANAGFMAVTNPVENIFFPRGGAPKGKYKVMLLLYQLKDRSQPSTPYEISVLVGSERKQYTGTISPDEVELEICEFELLPKIDMAVSPEVSLVQGQPEAVKVDIKVSRELNDDPITVEFTGDLAGATIPPVVIPPGKTAGEAVVTAAADIKPGERDITVRASTPSARSPDRVVRLKVIEAPKKAQWTMASVPVMAGWTAMIALGLVLALVSGQNAMLGQSVIRPGQAVVVTLGGAIAGAIAGGLGDVLLGMATKMALPPTLGIVLGWTLLGLLVGWGVGFFIPNLPKVRAGVAGMIGGLVGAGTFWMTSAVSEVGGRVLGAAILGGAIGLMVALVETIFRSACLIVWYGPKDSRMVNLGAEPVTVGDGNCTIRAKGFEGRALEYVFRQNAVTVKDVRRNVTEQAAHGDTRQVMNLKLEVRLADQPAGKPAGSQAPAPAGGWGKPTPPPQAAPPPAQPIAPAQANPVRPVSVPPGGLTCQIRLADGTTTVLREGAPVTGASIPGSPRTWAGAPMLELTRNPNTGQAGLRNLTNFPWPATKPSGERKTLEAGKAILIEPGLTLQVGDGAVTVL